MDNVNENTEQDINSKKYQVTKVLRIYKDIIEIGEQTPYEWILLKMFEHAEYEGITVSTAEIENGKELLDIVIPTLTERSADIIKKRSGLETGKKISRDEIASMYGVDSNRIQQIETKTLRMLSHPSRSKILLGKVECYSKSYNNNEYLKMLKCNLLNEMVSIINKEVKSCVYLDKICDRYDIKIYKPEMITKEYDKPLDEKYDVDNFIVETSDSNDLVSMGLSIRTCNCLKRVGITKYDQLLGLADEDLIKVRNLGEKGYNEVKDLVKKNLGCEGMPLYFLIDNSETIILSIHNQRIVYKYMGMPEKHMANSMLSTLFNLKKSKRLIDMQISPKLMEILMMKGYLFWDDVYSDKQILIEQLKVCQFDECATELQNLCVYTAKRNEKVIIYPGRNSICNFIKKHKCKNAIDIINNIGDTDDEEIKKFANQLKSELHI